MEGREREMGTGREGERWGQREVSECERGGGLKRERDGKRMWRERPGRGRKRDRDSESWKERDCAIGKKKGGGDQNERERDGERVWRERPGRGRDRECVCKTGERRGRKDQNGRDRDRERDRGIACFVS